MNQPCTCRQVSVTLLTKQPVWLGPEQFPGDLCHKKMLAEPSRACLCPEWGSIPSKRARVKVGNCARSPDTGLRVSLISRSRARQEMPDPTPQHPSPSSNSRWLQERLSGSEPILFISGEPYRKGTRQADRSLIHSPRSLSSSKSSLPPYQLPSNLLNQHPPLRSAISFPGGRAAPAWAHELGQSCEHPRPAIQSPTNNFLQSYLSSVPAQRNRGL